MNFKRDKIMEVEAGPKEGLEVYQKMLEMSKTVQAQATEADSLAKVREFAEQDIEELVQWLAGLESLTTHLEVAKKILRKTIAFRLDGDDVILERVSSDPSSN